jgi:exopolyphosphatase/guanosine-5'-triphosphate,3'-diphosphate pyrophosphatase
MRVAAVDLGTNSTRLLVADVDGGRVEDVARETRITRLGEGVDERRRLLPLPIARVRNTLSDFRRQAESLGAERTLLVATSAVRDAENGEAFLGEIEWSYGFATRLVSGEEEADLTYRGVTAGRSLEPGTIVVDLGGGSTELVAESLRISLDVGSVRLTERFLASDPPTPAELEEAAAAVRAVLAELVPDDLRASTTAAIGVAGTVTTLAALDLGLVEYDRERVHGHRIGSAAIDELLARLAALPVACLLYNLTLPTIA